MSKYKAKKTEVDGIIFDSKKEAKRYQELKLLEKSGKIKNLELQPQFLIQEGFRDLAGIKRRAINYRADFRYTDEEGRDIVEEVKGFETEAWKLKQKLFLFRYPNLYLNVIK